MQNRLEYIFFIGFSYLTKILGLQLSRRLAIPLAVFFYYLAPIRKKVVIENLVNSFPEYSMQKIREIAFGTYKSFAITLLETLYIPHICKQEMIKEVKCINLDLLKQKIDNKQGVVYLSAHFGNWEYFALSTALQLDHALYLIIKPQRNPYVTEFLNNARTKWHNEVIPMGVSVRQAYKVLSEKKMVAMAADQRGHKDGPRINFFKRPAAMYPGSAVLALRTGASLVYAIIYRNPDYSYAIKFEELVVDDITGTEDEKVDEILRRYINHLEQYIRKYPEQWLWMHKRWKY
jgi:KDO2-lipid IV(A) lauroyltransferase